MQKTLYFVSVITLVAALAVFVGCENNPFSTEINGPLNHDLANYQAAPLNKVTTAPTDLETVTFGPKSLEFWPYTGTNFTGTPQDPINLIFVGQAEPLEIRAALLSLDGDRSSLGLPPVPPFNSQWNDAIGDVQSGYATDAGWVGSTVQLTCGDYREARFHIRLFKMGDWTVANAHFEVLIPGTTDHQVLSWEVAEQFVIGDFLRSGLLDQSAPMMPTGAINDAPFRTIPDYIYNELPDELIDLIQGPAKPVDYAVPMGTDGHAMILNLASSVPLTPEERITSFVIDFDQTIPRPFCPSSEYDFIKVQGPVVLEQVTTLTEDGDYTSQFHADGKLSAVPVNPLTGDIIGEPQQVLAKEHHLARITGNNYSASSWLYQKLSSSDDTEKSSKFIHLKVNSNGADGYLESIDCADE